MTDEGLKKLEVLQNARDVLISSIKLGESKVVAMQQCVDTAKAELSKLDDLILTIE